MTTAEPITPVPVDTRSGPRPRDWTPDEFHAMQALGLFRGRAVGLFGGAVVEAVPGEAVPDPVAFTRSDFHALEAAGLFRGQRTQLVRGVVVREPPMLPPHATGVRKATRALERAFAATHDVRPQLPLELGPASVPLPDVAVVTGSIDDYAADHPTTAALVVEVAADSLFYDTTTKVELYASAGIAEYWVLDLVNRQLLVFRDPTAIPAGGHTYRTRLALGPADAVAPLAAPTGQIPVADLLP